MKTAQRGFTLLELMIAATIMLLAVVIAGSVMMAGVLLTRNAEQRVQESDEARMAMADIVKNVLSAGHGAGAGVYVKGVGDGSAQLYMPIFGMDGATGNGNGLHSAATPLAAANAMDDLWVIGASPNTLLESCHDRGAASTVTVAGTGILNVVCTGSFAAGDQLLVSNMDKAALITNANPAATTINYAESSSGISDSPEHGGFQVGDMVYGANVVHYFVKKDATGTPGLYKTTGALTGTAPTGTYPTGPYPLAGRPFQDLDQGTLVANHVEDLEVVYGFDTTGDGNPANFTWTNGLSPQVTGTGLTPVTLRAVRVSVGVRGTNLVYDNEDHVLLNSTTQPLMIENRYATQPPPDGYKHMMYTRTIELPNLNPGSL